MFICLFLCLLIATCAEEEAPLKNLFRDELGPWFQSSNLIIVIGVVVVVSTVKRDLKG